MARKKNVEHSPKFEMVRDAYQLYIDSCGTMGWSKKMVYKAVGKGWITADEYKEITGEDYE